MCKIVISVGWSTLAWPVLTFERTGDAVVYSSHCEAISIEVDSSWEN